MSEATFEAGRVHFDQREYFEAHEVWEDLWNEATGPRHPFLQGCIQVSVGLHHATTGNFNGTRKLFARALEYLEKGRPDSEPVDIDKLRDCVLDFEVAVQKKISGEDVPLPFFKLPVKE